jgi:hypothetical protein
LHSAAFSPPLLSMLQVRMEIGGGRSTRWRFWRSMQVETSIVPTETSAVCCLTDVQFWNSCGVGWHQHKLPYQLISTESGFTFGFPSQPPSIRIELSNLQYLMPSRATTAPAQHESNATRISAIRHVATSGHEAQGNVLSVWLLLLAFAPHGARRSLPGQGGAGWLTGDSPDGLL